VAQSALRDLCAKGRRRIGSSVTALGPAVGSRFAGWSDLLEAHWTESEAEFMQKSRIGCRSCAKCCRRSQRAAPASPPWRDRATACDQAVTALGGNKYPFAARPHMADGHIVRDRTIESLLAAPRACLYGAWSATAGKDHALASAAGEGAVAPDTSRLPREHHIQQCGIVRVGGGHFDRLDQRFILVGGDVCIVAMHQLAMAMASPSRFAVVSTRIPGRTVTPLAFNCPETVSNNRQTGPRCTSSARNREDAVRSGVGSLTEMPQPPGAGAVSQYFLLFPIREGIAVAQGRNLVQRRSPICAIGNNGQALLPNPTTRHSHLRHCAEALNQAPSCLVRPFRAQVSLVRRLRLLTTAQSRSPSCQRSRRHSTRILRQRLRRLGGYCQALAAK
jgi:hypothetical protein